MSVDQIILNQLGGMGKLSAMIGAHSFAAGDFGHGDGEGVSFKIKAKNKLGVKAVIITLNGLDLYKVRFVAIKNYAPVDKFMLDNVYADMLEGLFESELGLYLRF